MIPNVPVEALGFKPAEEPGALFGALMIGGQLFHVMAIKVVNKADEDAGETWLAPENEAWEEELDAIFDMMHEGPPEVLEIEGGRYILTMHPATT